MANRWLAITGPAAALTLTISGCAGLPTGAITTQESPGSLSTPSARPTPPHTAAEALRLWSAQGKVSYSYVYTGSCFCPTSGSFRIRVDHGKVSTVSPLNPKDPQLATLRFFPTVPELLQRMIEVERLTPPAAAYVAAFDPVTGAPRNVYIDTLANAIDDEMSWSVSNVHWLRN